MNLELRTLEGPKATVVGPAEHLDRLNDPDGWILALGQMHEAMTDLTGIPCGNADRLIIAYEEGTHGGMWAYADASRGHHIGVPPETWPKLIASANRRLVDSALVHEIGHVAMGWDSAVDGHRVLWPGAVEGLATPIGTYACWQYDHVPAWIDRVDGGADWLTLEDWANQWIDQGIRAVRMGSRGQDSVSNEGHGGGAAVVEAVMLDLIFHEFRGYEPLRALLRRFSSDSRGKSHQLDPVSRMETFFIELGRAAAVDFSEYLGAWGFDCARISESLAGLPVSRRRGVPTVGGIDYHHVGGPPVKAIPSPLCIELGLDCIRLAVQWSEQAAIDLLGRVRENLRVDGFALPPVRLKDDLTLPPLGFRVHMGPRLPVVGEIERGATWDALIRTLEHAIRSNI